MTPSQSAKAAGIKSLAEMSKMVGRDRKWLARTYVNHPELWEIMVLGCKEKLNNTETLL